MGEITGKIWIVELTEFDRFSGPKHFETKKFTDEKEAMDYANEINTEHSGKEFVPEWYLRATVMEVL